MKLHCERMGDGPPLVVLHGLLGSGDNWQPLAKKWSEHFTVLMPDLRNHGRSPHSPDAGFTHMAQDVVELLDAHGHAQVVVLGHSLGGKVAMQLALDFPERETGLVVVDIAPRAYPLVHEPLLRALIGVDLGQFATRSEVDSVLAGPIPQPAIRQWLLKNLGRDAAGKLMWKPNLPVLLEGLEELSGWFATSQKYEGRALFIGGGRSDYVTNADHGKISEVFPQARIETLTDAGHWVHVDAPNELEKLVREFAGGEV